MSLQKYFLTTAIDYIQARPHLGHALEKIGADALARFKRLTGHDVFFLTGTDEHSLNIQRQAQKDGVTPQVFCDRMVEQWLEIWKRLDISHDRFIRTTAPDHEKAVQVLFEKMKAGNHIYEGVYEGWYCPSCENFIAEKELVDGKCAIHQIVPERVKEKNYFLRLTTFQEPLLDAIRTGKFVIEPEIRRNEIVSFIEQGLQDVSVSRSSVSWGIPLSFDPTQTVWVWFDALINYLSGVGYANNDAECAKWWPADVHIIGKDITRFHCVIWPAMLIAAGIPLPKKVFAHGFISVEGQKMSKTRGTVVEPDQVLEKYNADVLRYYLLREVPFNGDGDFSWSRLEQRYNADLANDLGNLINRTLSMIKRYRDGVIPQSTSSEALDDEVRSLAITTAEKFRTHMDNCEFRPALEQLWIFITRCNQYVEQTTPWALAKDPSKRERLSSVLYTLAESCRIISILVSPVMPKTADGIRLQLGLPQSVLDFAEATQWGRLPVGGRLSEIAPLFPRATANPSKMA